ncbi:unnamed protein product [Durusdinium trenchii]|uniref:Uncharacterized protein n=1 Tax=Durusdinium trenchii TaxID=1381693 RepID=A0ABP0S7W7_9DINO
MVKKCCTALAHFNTREESLVTNGHILEVVNRCTRHQRALTRCASRWTERTKDLWDCGACDFRPKRMRDPGERGATRIPLRSASRVRCDFSQRSVFRYCMSMREHHLAEEWNVYCCVASLVCVPELRQVLNRCELPHDTAVAPNAQCEPWGDMMRCLYKQGLFLRWDGQSNSVSQNSTRHGGSRSQAVPRPSIESPQLLCLRHFHRLCWNSTLKHLALLGWRPSLLGHRYVRFATGTSCDLSGRFRSCLDYCERAHWEHWYTHGYPISPVKPLDTDTLWICWLQTSCMARRLPDLQVAPGHFADQFLSPPRRIRLKLNKPNQKIQIEGHR